MIITEFELKLKRVSITEDFFNELVRIKDSVKEALSKEFSIILNEFESYPDIEIEIIK